MTMVGEKEIQKSGYKDEYTVKRKYNKRELPGKDGGKAIQKEGQKVLKMFENYIRNDVSVHVCVCVTLGKMFLCNNVHIYD